MLITGFTLRHGDSLYFLWGKICSVFIMLIVLFEAVRILIGMEMAPVMIQTTMKPVFLTVEIAVDLMSIQFGAQNAYAFGVVEVVIRNGFWMVIVMMATIILIVNLMVGIVVDLMSIH